MCHRPDLRLLIEALTTVEVVRNPGPIKRGRVQVGGGAGAQQHGDVAILGHSLAAIGSNWAELRIGFPHVGDQIGKQFRLGGSRLRSPIKLPLTGNHDHGRPGVPTVRDG